MKSLESRLTVTIDDSDSDYIDSVKAQIQDFSWSIKDAKTSSLTIEVEFKNPGVYGLYDYKQFLKVQVAFSDFEPSWNDTAYFINVEIPKQYVVPIVSASAIASAEATGASTTAATATALGVNIAMSGAMSQVWGMINGM